MRRVPKPTGVPSIDDLREADMLLDHAITRLTSVINRTQPRHAVAYGCAPARLAVAHADLAAALVLCYRASESIGDVVFAAPQTTVNRPKSEGRR